MTAKHLRIDLQNGIQTLTISRPHALNALNQELLEELRAAMLEFYKNEEAHGMIITGEGEKSFVAGADIKEFSSINPGEAAAFARRGQDLFRMIEVSPKPVIAAVNGFALGGGCELAMACHLRIATQNAKFGQPEVTLGIIPGYGGTQRLTQLVGRGKALELMMTADLITAEEAKAIGLVNHVVATRQALIELSESIMKKILSNGRIAVANVIKSVNAGFSFEGAGYETEAESFGACVRTKDFREGTAAFVEKRKPKFTGE
ncbi:enoyl-CoA hydratase-related protein [Chryseolinea sp. T2]|uniref:enoyl-CoA hydratase/isomerase family protein n=1 Tax=Chryseolinea sp. T2 TaxID=3129255 RepID=UPI003077D786